jgi:hypothetical protein
LRFCIVSPDGGVFLTAVEAFVVSMKFLARWILVDGGMFALERAVQF